MEPLHPVLIQLNSTNAQIVILRDVQGNNLRHFCRLLGGRNGAIEFTLIQIAMAKQKVGGTASPYLLPFA
jgi:hypothetical protein